MLRNRQPNRPSASDNLSGRAPSTHDDLHFTVIQTGVVGIRNEIRDRVVADLAVPLAHQQKVAEVLVAVLSEVEREGVKAVTRLRRLRGDAVAVKDWRGVARRAMIAKLVSLFEDARHAFDDEQEDDGTGSACPRVDPKPRPAGGSALGLPADSRLPLLAHPDHLATSEDVARVVFQYALVSARWKVGSWSADSEEVENIAADATLCVLSRYQRLWDPMRGSLLSYLAISVRYAVHDEYVEACARKRNGQKLIENYERQLLEDLRTRGDITSQDPRTHDFHEELESKAIMDNLQTYIGRLNDHQRLEIERRLREDDPGTPAQQSTHSRAVAALRRMAS